MRPTDTEACVTDRPNQYGSGYGQNDYDAIVERLDDVLATLTGNMHEPNAAIGDSITLTKDGALIAIVRLARTRNWVKGIAESTRLDGRSPGGFQP